MVKKIMNENALYYGLILGVSLVILFLLFSVFSSTVNSSMQLVQFIVITVVIRISIKRFREGAMQGNITFGKGFLTGFLTLLYGAIINSMFLFVYYKLSPTAINRIIQDSKDRLYQSGLEGVWLEELIATQEKILTPGTLSMSTFFMTIFFGLIICSMVALFLRTKKSGIPER